MAAEEALLTAIKDSATRQEAGTDKMLIAVGEVSTDVRGLATAIAKGFAQQPSQQRANGPGTWPLLFAVGTLFVAMLSPVYIMVSAVSEQVDAMDARMIQDDVREIEDKEDAARRGERFTEVETQFDCSGARITREHEFQDQLIEWGRMWRNDHDRDALVRSRAAVDDLRRQLHDLEHRGE